MLPTYFNAFRILMPAIHADVSVAATDKVKQKSC